MRLAAASAIALMPAALCLAGEAALIDGSDPAAIAAIAGGTAVPADGQTGAPVIEAMAGASPYRVEFRDCDGTGGCRAIRLTARYAVAEVEEADIAEWNREQRYLTAVREDGGALVRMDVHLAGGVPPATVAAAFARWTVALARFEEHVGWAP